MSAQPTESSKDKAGSGPADVKTTGPVFERVARTSRAPKLSPNGLVQAEFHRVIFMAIPPAGTPIEALLDPEYWSHVAKGVETLNRIEVVPECGTYFAELMVLGVSTAGIKVKVLRYIPLELETPQGLEDSSFKVEWAGPKAKWRVIRKSDKNVLRDGFTQQDQARQWLGDHLKAQG